MGGGRDDEISIYLSIIDLTPPALVLFRGRNAAVKSNFYGGWRRAAFIMMVWFFLIDLGGGGGRGDEDSIHPSITDLVPPALVFFCGHNTAVEPNFYGGWCHVALVMMV